MSDDAKVRVGLEGSAEATRKLKDLKKEFLSFGSEIGRVAEAAIGSFASLATALTKIDPATQADKFRTFRQSVTEFSIASGTSIDKLKIRFQDLSSKTLLPDDQLQSFSASLAKTTHDFGDSTKALDAMRQHGLMTGRSLEEMGPIAATLHNSFGKAFNEIPGSLDKIAGAAEALGTVGGPGALEDQVASLGDVISHVATKGKQDFNELIGIMAAVGKGRSADQAQRLQQALVGRFASGGEQMRLNLGIKRKDFYDDEGHVKVNSENVQKLRDFYVRKTGSLEGAKSLASFSNNLGPELASAIFRPDFMKDVVKGAAASPSHKGQTALDRLTLSDAGKDAANQLARQQRAREEVGGATNKLQQAGAGMMPDSPWASMAMNSVGGGLGQMAAGYLTRKTFETSAKNVADALLGVGESAGKATVGLGGLAGQLGGGVSAGTAAVGVGGAVAGGAAIAGLGLGAVAMHDKLLMGLDLKKASNDFQQDLASGRKKITPHWYGNSLDTVSDPTEQRKAAKEYQDFRVSHGLKPLEVKVTIQDDSHNPNRVVAVAKGTAGQQ